MSAISTHRPWSRLRASPNSQFAFGLTRHTRWEIPGRRRAPSAGSPSRDSFLSATRRVSILANQCWGSQVSPSCRWRKEPQARCRRLCRRWWARLWKWNSNIIVSKWRIEHAELSAGAACKSSPSTLFILHLKSYQIASTYAERPAAKRYLRSVFNDSAGEGLWNLICLQKTWLRLFMLPRELCSVRVSRETKAFERVNDQKHRCACAESCFAGWQQVALEVRLVWTEPADSGLKNLL